MRRSRLVLATASALLILGIQAASRADEPTRLASSQSIAPAQLREWLGIHRAQSVTYTGPCGGAVYQGPNRVDCSKSRGTRPVCFSNGVCGCAYDSHCD